MIDWSIDTRSPKQKKPVESQDNKELVKFGVYSFEKRQCAIR